MPRRVRPIRSLVPDTAVLVRPLAVACVPLAGHLPPAPSDGQQGRCDLCGACAVVVVPIGAVVSANFTEWDRFPREARFACAVCAWGYGEPRLRTSPVIVSGGSARYGEPDDVAVMLGSPLAGQTAVTVPLAGRKHLLPYAEWGCVTTDSGTFAWARQETVMLIAVTALRAAGVPDSAVRVGTVPPGGVFRAENVTVLLAAWETVRAWRGTPQFALACRVANRSEKTSRDTLAVETPS